MKAAFARDCDRDPLPSPLNEGACSWCSIGALHKVANTPYWSPLIQVHLERAICEIHNTFAADLANFNDRHSHDQVLAVFDRAIEAGTRTDPTPGELDAE